MKRYETGRFGNKPGRWEETAKTRPDVAASRLSPPSVLFPKELYFDDGEHRVELLHLGVAHTHGDAFAWLPNSESCSAAMRASTGLTTTSAMATSEWIATLDAAKKLGAKLVCPGHGARGDGGVLDNQQQFFRELRERVGKLVQAKKTPREIYSSIEGIRGELKSQSPIARYVGDGLAAQVEKVHQEMTGKPFPPEVKAAKSARLRHAHDHSLQLA